MFHYASAPSKAHKRQINGLARHVANVFSSQGSSWVKHDEVFAEAVEFAQMPANRRPFVMGQGLAFEPGPPPSAKQIRMRASSR
jgi:hypothetical protein